jgi:hypothetical protein
MTALDLDNFVKFIVENLKSLRANGTITRQNITKYSDMCRHNVHSWLQWSVIYAGQRLGLICVPEFKLYFSKPLDPSEFGINGKRRHHIKVDVAVFKKFNEFLGFVECITFDEAHECFSTRDVNFKWLTFKDKLPFAIKNLEIKWKPKFIILIVVLPKNVKQIPWKTGNPEIDSILETKKYFENLSPRWKELVKSVKGDVETRLIFMNEDEILLNQ